MHRLTRILAAGLADRGIEVITPVYFDTLTLRVPGRAAQLAAQARKQGINLRLVDRDHLGVALDETTRREHLETLWQVLGSGRALPDFDALDRALPEVIPAALRRASGFLRIRCSGSITARPRCCAICAVCRTRTWRSIAP